LFANPSLDDTQFKVDHGTGLEEIQSSQMPISLLKTGALLQETLHKHNIKEMEETELLSVVWSQCSKSTEGK
jgi:hypothetical protein